MAVVSLGSFLYYYQLGLTTAYLDSQSYLVIARRVVDSPTTGFGQLGGVWLWAKQVLTLPFIWWDPLYENGIAGCISSMVAFIATGWLVFATVWRLTSNYGAAILGTVLFASNANVLYLQGTPMSETLLYVFMMLSTYFLVIWIANPNAIGPFVCLSVAVFLAASTRYEGWALLPTVGMVIVYVAFRQPGWTWRHVQDRLFLYSFIAGSAPLLWMIWNWLIFGSPMAFSTGEYAAPSNWVGGTDPAVGSFDVSTRTFWYATVHNLGILVALVTVLGLVYSLWRFRLHPHSAVLLLLASQFLYFIGILYLGQRPLYVPEINGGMINIRFALQMILLAAVVAGVLAARHRIMLLALVIVIGINNGIVLPRDIITLDEPQQVAAFSKTQDTAAAGACLGQLYDGSGMILMETFGNEAAVYSSDLPLDHIIYEGTYKTEGMSRALPFTLWDAALLNPTEYVEWLFVRSDPTDPDKPARVFGAYPERLVPFTPVYQNPSVTIYHLGPLPSAATQCQEIEHV